MNIKLLSAIALFFVATCIATAQNEPHRHTVTKGETITQIAQKYRITPHDIYQLNPTAKNGIRENDVILIPASEANKPASRTHTVLAKETMYGISKQYGVTVDALRQANPVLSEGLKVGQVIVIPGSAGQSQASPIARAADALPKSQSSGSTTTHTVEPKETKYGIAKKYGITVAELERQNPGIVEGLPVGYKLTIRTQGAIAQKPAPTVNEIGRTETVTTESIRTPQKTVYANYEVKPGETLFSLTQSLRVTEAELFELNPYLKDGLRAGMILKVPGRGSVIRVSGTKIADLTRTLNTTDRKKLAILIPFNAQRIQGDTARSVSERLKKDAFLNMTLDFYSGVLMAIDSAKTLGLNVDVNIYDSGESRASSDVLELVRTKNLRSVDAVVGPFYQQYAETLAEALQADNVPVISPMSKEDSKPFPNLYQAMPSEEIGKRVVLDYMVAKGKVIVISDPKRQSNRDFIMKNYPEVQFAAVDENGVIDAEKLKAMFAKDRLNFVVIDSERTGMILSATNIMLNETANYNLQLAIIQQNETLDFEEISMNRLTLLKLLYPSLTRDNSSPEALAFEHAYRRDNKVFPNQYAVRGFDVTFDTLLRLSQDKPFSASAVEDITEHLESRFQYKGNNEGFKNEGVFILQYNEDLTVKQVN